MIAGGIMVAQSSLLLMLGLWADIAVLESAKSSSRPKWAWQSQQSALHSQSVQGQSASGQTAEPWRNRLRLEYGPLDSRMSWRGRQWEEGEMHLSTSRFRLSAGQIDYDRPGGLFAFLTSHQDPSRRALAFAMPWPSATALRVDMHALAAWVPHPGHDSGLNLGLARHDEGLVGLGLRFRQNRNTSEWQTLTLHYRLEREYATLQEQWVQGLGARHKQWPLTWMAALHYQRQISQQVDSTTLQSIDGYAEAQWTQNPNPQHQYRLKVQWVGKDWAWPLSPRFARPEEAFGFDQAEPIDSLETRPSDSARQAQWRLQVHTHHKSRDLRWGQFTTSLSQRWAYGPATGSAAQLYSGSAQSGAWAVRTYASQAWRLAGAGLKAWAACEVDPKRALANGTAITTGWQIEWRPAIGQVQERPVDEPENADTHHPIALMVFGKSEKSEWGLKSPRAYRLALKMRLPMATRMHMQGEAWCDWPRSEQELTLGIRLSMQGR